MTRIREQLFAVERAKWKPVGHSLESCPGWVSLVIRGPVRGDRMRFGGFTLNRLAREFEEDCSEHRFPPAEGRYPLSDR